ncbi:MAG TPA: putative toxin-antitoxin system toxin component, PIN family [Pirellulales bacterium]|nr:putative toxin-antitoxin system toxin component, PIN family [Pirellulales bacterium]
MRVVLDTNVLARATPGRKSPAEEVVARAVVPPNELALSAFLLAELERVLRYDRVRRIHQLDEEDLDLFVKGLCANALHVELTKKGAVAIVPNDPQDDPVVATAVEGKAEVICTLDRHLHHPDVVAYCAKRGIRVMTDVELLQVLRAQDG